MLRITNIRMTLVVPMKAEEKKETPCPFLIIVATPTAWIDTEVKNQPPQQMATP